MADRDASKVQLDFPQLTADLIAALRLTGTLGLLNLADTVVPVISVGNVRPQTFAFDPVTFQSAETEFGEASNPVVNTVLADTGPLGAGTYNIMCSLSLAASVSAVNSPLVFEHRNAANTITLATLLSIAITTTRIDTNAFLPVIGYVIGLNERLRIKTPNDAILGSVSGTIYASIRPTP